MKDEYYRKLEFDIACAVSYWKKLVRRNRPITRRIIAAHVARWDGKIKLYHLSLADKVIRYGEATSPDHMSYINWHIPTNANIS